MARKIIVVIVVIQCVQLNAQDGRGGVRFVWYNVENYFDPFDDSLTADNEFLPGALRHWTWKKFVWKTESICKVITAAGGWKPPEIVGLAEVENEFVLYRLCRESPLMKFGYRWIHKDSPDPRGIDIALMYLPQAFRPLQHSFHRVILSTDLEAGTRDILYVKGIVHEQDTLHIILNHWPSRWEGKLETEYRRMAAAGYCRYLFDSIKSMDSSSAILVSGDFNDEIDDASLGQVLGVREFPLQSEDILDTLLYSLSFETGRHVRGSLKYQGSWYLFDQVFASGNLMLNRTGQGLPAGLHIPDGKMKIFRPGFLLERDEQWTGMKPFRTWKGVSYSGGFSDHLPVIVDLYYRGTE